MAREYIARDPRTGKALRNTRVKDDSDIRALSPNSGPWESIPRSEIIRLASGEVGAIDLPEVWAVDLPIGVMGLKR